MVFPPCSSCYCIFLHCSAYIRAFRMVKLPALKLYRSWLKPAPTWMRWPAPATAARPRRAAPFFCCAFIFGWLYGLKNLICFACCFATIVLPRCFQIWLVHIGAICLRMAFSPRLPSQISKLEHYYHRLVSLMISPGPNWRGKLYGRGPCDSCRGARTVRHPVFLFFVPVTVRGKILIVVLLVYQRKNVGRHVEIIFPK